MANYPFQIIPHVNGSDPDCADSLSADPSILASIALRIASKFVRQTIDLNGKTGFMTEEVENIRPNRVLATKFEAFRSRLEDCP